MHSVRQLFLSFFLLGLFILKSQGVGSSTYLDVRYGEEKYSVCPFDDGWNSYWAKLELALGSLSYEESISGDPYYEFDELCPKDTFTTCGCLYREFAKTLMIKLNERSIRIFGKEALPSRNTGYENWLLFIGPTVRDLFTDKEEYFSLLSEIEEELHIYLEKDICAIPENKKNTRVCGNGGTLGINLIAHSRLLQLGTYLFGFQYEGPGLSFGGSIPSASKLEFGHDFLRVEKECRVIFSEEQKAKKFREMNVFLWESDTHEQDGMTFCPVINGRRTLLSHNPAIKMIARELCPSRFQELN